MVETIDPISASSFMIFSYTPRADSGVFASIIER